VGSRDQPVEGNRLGTELNLEPEETKRWQRKNLRERNRMST